MPQQILQPLDKSFEADTGGPSTLAVPRVDPGEPVGRMVSSALNMAELRMTGCDANARLGVPEAIHRLRTTTRRLRSELRSLEDFVNPRWLEQLETELKWLAGQLGAVRDLDILTARLKEGAKEHDDDGSIEAALAPLFATLDGRREHAAQSLSDALRSDRYRRLLAGVEEAGCRPPLTDAASEPCRLALPPVVVEAWRRLKKQGRALKRSDPDAKFHELRKRAKRTRYTAELIAPVMGRRLSRDAAGFIRRLTRIQDTLGEHQDAVVAAGEIEQVLAQQNHDREFVRAADKLLASEHKKAHAARESFFDVWDKLDRKKSRRWMKIRTKAKAGA